MTDPNPTADGAPSAVAARALAAVLIDVADAIESDDLLTVSSAMTEVRAAARRLERSLSRRGWGGDVLYGWGARDDEDDELMAGDPVDGDEAPSDGDENLLDAQDGPDDGHEDPDNPAGGQTVPEHAIRVTCQSRSDFYLIDEAALIAHDVRRAAELGLDWDHEFVAEHGAFYCFTELWGLDRVDLTGTGLAPAGSQNATHRIDQSLWEMDVIDYELRDDAFPTAG